MDVGLSPAPVSDEPAGASAGSKAVADVPLPPSPADNADDSQAKDLVGCFGFYGPLRQYFSLYRAVSQREGERGEKG